jgi:peptidoglycan/xylan/chitin deacetylase (PgdA/CDA1 family)
VISLDFEIHWGVRDHEPADGGYAANLHGVRDAVPAMLATFAAYDVAATWATVGMLFARSRADLDAWRPPVTPRYHDARLDAYAEPVGESEADDPLHYAPSLIRMVRETPRQEVATHTYSHYYGLEAGQSVESFRADIAAAGRAAAAHGVTLRSIVYPRNQRNPAYDDVLREAGITAYRDEQRAWMFRGTRVPRLGRRAGRFVDAYTPLAGGYHLARWNELRQPGGLCNVPASHFLRPWSRRWAGLEGVRRRRIVAAMRRAARESGLFHLWWHPHNFGVNLAENIAFLESLLDTFAELRASDGMQSLSMIDAADAAPECET